jgi:GTP-binding protein EngB required for normal cell division
MSCEMRPTGSNPRLRATSMSDMREILDLFDRLVAACTGIVPADVLEGAAETGRAARRRIGYLGDVIVVALAGGTGSGKSSIVNALADEEVSPPGSQRPTTADPVAWIPSSPEPGLTRLLDDIGIENRIGHDDQPWLALVDLPDTDSVVAEHRATVDRILPLVDAVVWVLDPEKYQDARLHRDHLRPLASSSDRFVFVLNQIDRLPAGEVDEVAKDLRRSLEADGIFDPKIVVTAADPPTGITVGLDELVAAIRHLGSARDVVERRVLDELDAAAARLVEPLGGAGGTGFSARWTSARDDVAASIATAIDADLERAGGRVADQDARMVASLVGGRQVADGIDAGPAAVASDAAEPIREAIEGVAAGVERDTRVALVEIADRIDEEVDGIVTGVGAAMTVDLPPPPSWWSAVRLLFYGVGAMALLGVVLVFDALRSSGGLMAGTAWLFGAVGMMVALRRLIQRSSRERVRHALDSRQQATETLVAAELERRIGRPLRNILRARSAPGAAHMEFTLAVQRMEERQT